MDKIHMAAILADGIFKCIFLDENDKIPIQIFPKISALVQIMAWCRTGDKDKISFVLCRTNYKQITLAGGY